MKRSIVNYSCLAFALGLLDCGTKPASDDSPQGSEVESGRAPRAASLRSRTSPKPSEVVPGEVIVKLKHSEDAEGLRAAARTGTGVLRHARSSRLDGFFGRRRVQRARPVFPGARLERLRRTFVLQSQGSATEELLEELRAMPEVEYAEPNRIHHLTYTPNDPYFSTSGAWGQSYRDLWGLQKLEAETAWDSSRGKNVIVAVVDTGVDYNHPDISANIWKNQGETGTDAQGRDRRSNGVDDDRNGYVDDWHGYNFISNDSLSSNDPMDINGHGTHVAGTIAATGNNGLGVVGVAPEAQIMAIRGLDRNVGNDADLAAAIHYAADNGAKVINASFGSRTLFGLNLTMIDAVNYAHDVKGVVVVAGVGNDATDAGGEFLDGTGFYPAAALNAIAVSAVTHLDELAGFSNFGFKVDVAAPGGGDAGSGVAPGLSILSLLSSRATARQTGDGAYIVGERYLRLLGTSMATPHVAGVAALIRSQDPNLSPEQVRQALRAGSDDIASVGFDASVGYGRVNARKALTLAAPLAVKLTGPLKADGLAQVPVVGMASGNGFSSYRLEYGVGSQPTSWTTIATSSASVTNGTLGVWDLTAISDGRYTLRLVGRNSSGQSFEDRLPIEFDNVLITAPLAEERNSFRPGQTVPIAGAILHPNFTRYTVSVSGLRTGPLANPNITLTNGGMPPVYYGQALASWNTTGVAADHYTIQVSVALPSGNVAVESTKVIVDPSLHAGWPLAGSYSRPVYALTASDLDGNGAAELIVGQGWNVNVFQHDGTQRSGWPKTLDAFGSETVGPVAGDITGDGVPEIMASSVQGTVYAWSRDGASLPGWPRTLGSGRCFLALTDFNRDGSKEIVVVDFAGGLIRVVDRSGNTLPGWPVFTGPINQPSVGDLDGDGTPEIIMVTHDGMQVNVLSSTGQFKIGTIQIGTTFDPEHSGTSLPALVDLDADGRLDIVVGNKEGSVFALHGDGTQVPGWPKSTAMARVNSPAVGDIDGDGRPEVVVGIDSTNENGVLVNYLYAWHHDGSALPGWPIRYAPGFTSAGFGFGSPTMADVDGDGKVDVVVSSDATDDPYALHAFRNDGTEIAGFPKMTASFGPSPVNAAAVADFDGDGLLELAWADRYTNDVGVNSKLVMWDLTGPKAGAQPWPMFHHDPQKSGMYSPSNSGGAGGTGAGGASSTGGATATGGRTSSGGASSTGGATATGGRTSTGGASSTGGATATGGRTSTGGAGSGGQSGTGGSGGGTNPCASLCSNPLVFGGPNYQSGNLGSNTICRETTATLNGGNCSNMQGRVLTINGVAMSCSNWSLPAKLNGGYCIQVTAGAPDWASFATW